MEFNEVLNNVLYIVLTAIVPVVTTYVINLIKVKIKESDAITEATKNEDASNLIKDALNDVMDAVLYVNQIYTDSLKASGRFDEKAQKEAFNRAYVEAMNLISNEAKEVIQNMYGSFDKWLQLKIESSVNMAKKEQV
jgi:hypothetical protein